MTPLEHAKRAKTLADRAEYTFKEHGTVAGEAMFYVALAQVHATLATAGKNTD